MPGAGLEQKVIYQGLITSYPGLGPHIPAAFRSDLDVAVQLPAVYTTRRTMLIKGDQCAVIMWGEGVGYQGLLSGMQDAGWKMLPEGMSGDFDHAVVCMHGGVFKPCSSRARRRCTSTGTRAPPLWAPGAR